MRLEGSWAISENGELVHIRRDDKITPIVSEGNEELFLKVSNYLIDPSSIARQRNKVAIKALYLYLLKLSSEIDTTSLSDGVRGSDIPVTKTAVASLVNWMLFNGDYEDIPEYIRRVL